MSRKIRSDVRCFDPSIEDVKILSTDGDFGTTGAEIWVSGARATISLVEESPSKRY